MGRCTLVQGIFLWDRPKELVEGHTPLISRDEADDKLLEWRSYFGDYWLALRSRSPTNDTIMIGLVILWSHRHRVVVLVEGAYGRRG